MLNAFFPFAETTQEVTVRVAVNFMADQSPEQSGRWVWGYHIRIENDGALPVQLLTRHWEISDGHGITHIVDGEGVVGKQPVIAPGESFDYVSGCPLNTPHGKMEGSYQMLRSDGMSFEALIPAFALSAPVVRG